MLDWLFRRPIRPRLPLGTSELSEALHVAAHYADTDAARLEYTNAADALDRAVAHTRAHGDEPTRDALAYALGRAELGLKDQLQELIEVSKDTHLLVQTVHGAQSEQGAVVVALRAEFHGGMQQVGERLTDLEGRTGTLERTVAAHDESRDRSIEERRLLRADMDASKTHRAQIQRTLDAELPAIKRELSDLAEAVHRIETLLEVAGEHEAGG